MKVIKKFATEAAYNSWVSSTAATFPNVCIIGEGNDRVVKMNGSRDLVCKFNVTTTEESTKIIHNLSGIKKIYIDGGPISPITSYTFTETGEHVLRYTYAGTGINAYQFSGVTTMTDLYIPLYLQSINVQSFVNCTSLSSVTFEPGSLKSGNLGNNAFSYCKIPKIDFPYGMPNANGQYLEYMANIDMLHITIPDTCTYIANAFLRGLRKNYTATIGSSVASIGEMAFHIEQYVNGIVTLKSVIPPNNRSLDNGNVYRLYVPKYSLKAYKTAANFSAIANKIFPIEYNNEQV